MGHHNRHFAGDPHSLTGAWSPPTSAANFCEEDYALTRYIAEFINTLTNFTYVFLALKYMYGPGGRGLLKPNYDFMSVSLFILGVCSFLYHASLRQYLQFADDLSMLLLGSSMLYGLLAVRQTPARRRRNAALLTAITAGFSVFYVRSGKIIYHVLAFATQMAAIGLRSLYLFYWQDPSQKFSQDKIRDWKSRQWQSIFIALFGYLIWNIDLEFCAELRNLRAQIGLPWAWLLELHGWWHILTAIGADRFMKIVREMDAEKSGEKGKAGDKKAA